jgi:predicted metalloprotease
MESLRSPLPRRIASLTLRGSLALAALSGCGEENNTRITYEKRVAVRNETAQVATDVHQYWNDQRPDDERLDPVTLAFDDDSVSLICDALARRVEEEVFYCNVDGRLAINPTGIIGLMDRLDIDSSNPEVVTAFIKLATAHEMGHWKQDKDKAVMTVYEAERDADCKAGASLVKSTPPGMLPLYLDIAERIGSNPNNPSRSHGSTIERPADFLHGFTNGSDSCATIQ